MNSPATNTDPHYIAHYNGDQRQRDGAYHQGTVWPWLLGAFARAHFTLYGDKQRAASYLAPLQQHLSDTGVGQINEIFDAVRLTRHKAASRRHGASRRPCAPGCIYPLHRSVSMDEETRLRQDGDGPGSWKYWGPYLSERQWGTVREDYSTGGNAWDYLPHDHARSRAYRWGEDGIAGFSDLEQRLCLAVALWNEKDQILKERLFGLTNSEGNHGEDVKELYYYLDATPSHSYLRMLYKYPQAAFPYQNLLDENRRRGIGAPEYELIDTGVFDEDRYFDVFVEYAQAEPGDILLRVTAHNRGPFAAPLHLLPTVWFRNTWSWTAQAERPQLQSQDPARIDAHHATLGDWHL